MADETGATVVASVETAIDIPKDGTLSRTLYQDDQIRVVIFGFDTGQQLTEHTAAVPAIIEVVSGRLELTLDTEEVEATPGTWVHMPPNLPHSVAATEPSVMLLTMLRT